MKVGKGQIGQSAQDAYPRSVPFEAVSDRRERAANRAVGVLQPKVADRPRSAGQLPKMPAAKRPFAEAETGRAAIAVQGPCKGR